MKQTLAPRSLPHPVRIGCAGWNVPKLVSPSFATDGSHLERYSRVFNCCEINSSFYRSHKNETWRRWAETVPEDFRFSVKLSKAITHEAKLVNTAEPLSRFFREIAYLGEKLGTVLIQLPPSLKFDPSVVHTFFSQLRKISQNDIVCEPRHETWFDERVNELLKEFHVGRVAADPPCVPVAGTPGGDPDLAYFRLHGSPRRYYSSYNSQFLSELASELRRLSTNSRTWCIFDNTASGSAIENAMVLNAQLREPALP